MPTTVIEALTHVMDDVRAVAKNDRNDAQRFYFRGIDSVMNAVGPSFRKHGVVAVPEVIERTYIDRPGANGRVSIEVRAVVAYHFHVRDSEDVLTTTVIAEARDYADKATAKVMSVAFRTALLQVLCLPTDDKDPDAEYPEVPTAQPPQPQRPPVQSPMDKAKAKLGAACDSAGLDRGVVARFAITPEGGGVDISVATGDEAARKVWQLADRINDDTQLVQRLKGGQ